MPIPIIFYKNTSEKIKVNKKLENLLYFKGDFRNTGDITNPVIIFEQYPLSFLNCNYCYISNFKRYYYITKIEIINNFQTKIYLSVDVLMSFKNEILQQKQLIQRQENQWNTFINDGSLKIYQDPIIFTKQFPNGFNDNCYILTVQG